jgi:hypothetical protein
MIKLAKTKFSDETFFVEFNKELNIWERIDNNKYYHEDELIFIRDI